MTNQKLVAEKFVEDLTVEEKERAALVESMLPILREYAEDADRQATFPTEVIDEFRSRRLLGLLVPKEFGGLGGGLRDLAAATRKR